MLGSAAKYILCLLYARTVGSLPKQHRGCSNFFGNQSRLARAIFILAEMENIFLV